MASIVREIPRNTMWFSNIFGAVVCFAQHLNKGNVIELLFYYQKNRHLIYPIMHVSFLTFRVFSQTIFLQESAVFISLWGVSANKVYVLPLKPSACF